MPIGIVEKIEGEYAIVQIKRQDMCGDCHACDAVHEAKSCTLKCINNVSSKVGDTVEISADNKTFLKATFIMYGLPLAGLIVGILVGYVISAFISQIDSELLMILGAVLGMMMTFVIIKNRDKKNKYNKMLPHIISIKNSTY
ncbi:SoxR reducing system RseC family protein [Cellulosilyticum sp. I15G10I2]|uniref:SoxR reducing system RseC family protein n=1 Tax=Cellulosilyticum sp. I15G10I2 TaxID=1892843 RepID=UPI00085C5591|nr:SoxR reducing system RseC family protein [Cellulosilyticum sp. I15G10I2]